MCIESMVKSFQSVHMADWDGETEIGNGYKDVSAVFVTYEPYYN